MAKFALSVVAPAANTNLPLCVIRAGANAIRIKRIKLVCATAVASSIGLVRAATNGTATTSTPFQQLQAADQNSVTNIDTAWSAAPTISATPAYLERATIGGVIGNGDVWTFADEIAVPANGAVALWNFGAGSSAQMQVSVTIEE